MEDSVIAEYKLKILNELLQMVGLSFEQMPTTVDAAIFEQAEIVDKLKKYVPLVRKFYSSDRLTSLHSNAFDKQKNPALNLYRQLLKEHHCEIRSNKSKGAPNQTYIVRKVPEKIKLDIKLAASEDL